MFQKGSLIVYGNTGVCCVEDIGASPYEDSAQPGAFYKLCPLHSSETIYIPVDTSVFMRPVISKQEADRLIAKIPTMPEKLCESEDQKVLADHYRASIRSHDCEHLLQLIKSAYLRTKAQSLRGKRPTQTDQQYRKRAEDLLHEEFSIALKLPMEEVSRCIQRAVEAV